MSDDALELGPDIGAMPMNMAANPMATRIRPKFQVRKLEGTVTRTKHKYVVGKNKKGKPSLRREMKPVEEDAGYLVAFPGGHTIRLADYDAVKKLGFDNQAELVDMETGVALEQQISLDLFQSAQYAIGGGKLA